MGYGSEEGDEEKKKWIYKADFKQLFAKLKSEFKLNFNPEQKKKIFQLFTGKFDLAKGGYKNSRNEGMLRLLCIYVIAREYSKQFSRWHVHEISGFVESTTVQTNRYFNFNLKPFDYWKGLEHHQKKLVVLERQFKKTKTIYERRKAKLESEIEQAKREIKESQNARA